MGPINHERRLTTHDVEKHANAPLGVETLKLAQPTREGTRDNPHSIARLQIGPQQDKARAVEHAN